MRCLWVEEFMWLSKWDEFSCKISSKGWASSLTLYSLQISNSIITEPYNAVDIYVIITVCPIGCWATMVSCVGFWLCQMLREISNDHTLYSVLFYSRIIDIVIVSEQQVPMAGSYRLVKEQRSRASVPLPLHVFLRVPSRWQLRAGKWPFFGLNT